MLLSAAGPLPEADQRLAPQARPAAAAALVPPDWTDGAPYAEHLERRLEPPREWMEEAERARA